MYTSWEETQSHVRYLLMTVFGPLQVSRGDVESVAASSSSHALFLCYPPSDSTMASESLQAFRYCNVSFHSMDSASSGTMFSSKEGTHHWSCHPACTQNGLGMSCGRPNL